MQYRSDLELLLNCLSRICRARLFHSLVRVGVRPLIFYEEFLVLIDLIIVNFGGLIVQFRPNCSLVHRTLAKNRENMVFWITAA